MMFDMVSAGTLLTLASVELYELRITILITLAVVPVSPNAEANSMDTAL